MAVDKLTLVVHPFNFIKPMERGSTAYITTMNYGRLADSPDEVIEDSVKQLQTANWRKDEIDQWLELSKKYKQGIVFAKDGKVLFLRAPVFNMFLSIEQDLIRSAKENIPPKNL